MSKRRAGPASRLVGRTLDDGWQVMERIDRPSSTSGGNFSVGYRVVHPDGRRAFMKALDFSRAHAGGKFSIDTLKAMVAAYVFERDLLEVCSQAQMSRVVRALAFGSIEVEGSDLPVHYLIFELADGDVRGHITANRCFDLTWKLGSLHDVAVGLSQLHSTGIIHQDLKPSNVLVFRRLQSKVGDLGSADYRGTCAPLFVDRFAGDPDYAPPELLYDFELADRREQLRAQDLYLFGSLMLFFFLETNTTPALLVKMAPSHHPRRDSMSFETALPHLQEAFDLICGELGDTKNVPAGVVAIFRELCHPDPRQRGNPAAGRFGDRYALNRYVTRLDLLWRRAGGASAQRRLAA